MCSALILELAGFRDHAYALKHASVGRLMWPHVCSLLREGKLAPCPWNVTNELYYLASSNQSKILDNKIPEDLPE
jgi:hypothetical protein